MTDPNDLDRYAQTVDENASQSAQLDRAYPGKVWHKREPPIFADMDAPVNEPGDEFRGMQTVGYKTIKPEAITRADISYVPEFYSRSLMDRFYNKGQSL